MLQQMSVMKLLKTLHKRAPLARAFGLEVVLASMNAALCVPLGRWRANSLELSFDYC